jgi:hypothetical protein
LSTWGNRGKLEAPEVSALLGHGAGKGFDGEDDGVATDISAGTLVTCAAAPVGVAFEPDRSAVPQAAESRRPAKMMSDVLPRAQRPGMIGLLRPTVIDTVRSPGARYIGRMYENRLIRTT